MWHAVLFVQGLLTGTFCTCVCRWDRRLGCLLYLQAAAQFFILSGDLPSYLSPGKAASPCDSSPQRRVYLDDYRSEGFLKVNDLPTSSQRACNVHPVILRSKIGLMRRDLPRAWLSCKLHCLILSGEGLRENIFCS